MSIKILSDKELVENYIKGDLASFEQLISRHQSRIFTYILMLVKDKQLADDIFQDTFLKIIRTIKAGMYKDEGKFLQFAMRIAHNLVIDYFRKSKRIPTVDSSSEDYNFIDNTPISDPSVEQAMITNQVYDDLKKMINFLPAEQREVLCMRMYSDMSFKDIAETTNVSINTALGRMRYALINLRKMLKENNVSIAV
jgi:RNA polymerase sigma factor, sigma-70 family